MIPPEELVLTSKLNAARGELFKLLTEEERKTNRVPGSDYPITFEDKARGIAEGEGNDSRRLDVALAMNEFVAALNEVLVYVNGTEIDRTLAAKWLTKSGVDLGAVGVTFDDLQSEAFFEARHALAKGCPDKQKLFTYLYKIIFRKLTIWWGRQQAPVEMPEKVARNPESRPSRAALDDGDWTYPPKEDEDDHRC